MKLMIDEDNLQLMSLYNVSSCQDNKTYPEYHINYCKCV